VQIKIPLPVVRAADCFGDWLNVILIRRGRLVIRYVDIAVGLIGTINAIWWYQVSGWWGALEGVLMFTLAIMIANWFF
jgi:hypothetical protein